ncbi:RNA binding protein [Purpureocillium lavendulum]|uniref:RNA binding protein n=1 Tax=Purpureocillium lavendulum TaxID=1247861 RepID=A0AB34G4B5_9HYPO|nr:RNA binding protein [Purpureocillium lavendulum]
MPWKQATVAGPKPRAAHKSIRGNISAPIQVSQRDDDEFPMREPAQPGGLMAVPLVPNADGIDILVGAKGSANGGPRPPDGLGGLPRAESVQSGSHAGVMLSGESDDSPSASAHRRSSGIVTQSTRESGHMTTTISSGTAKGGPQRKKSTFRSALSKIFGRKKRRTDGSDTGALSDSRKPSKPSHSHHQSDLGGGSRRLKTVQPKRSASLPITEYDRALRSHSIGPDDVMAIRSARNSLNAGSKLAAKAFGDLETAPARPAGPRWTEGRKFTGLSPRPASSQDRATRLADFSDDPNEIGRAITSDGRGLRRRSRSLSAFPGADHPAHAHIRRRSDEIRHWRESYDLPIMSPASFSVAESEDIGALTGDDPETIVDEQPRTPVQPFAFGDANSMKELAGLKITEAASLSSRIGNLEAQMSHLEHAVTRLGKSSSGSCANDSTHGSAKEASSVPYAYTRHSAANETGRRSFTRPSTRQSDASKMTFGDGQHAREAFPAPSLALPAPNYNRPTSMSTIRGTASMPSMTKETAGSIGMDHYMTVMSLLETERSAREALELQVRKLTHQLNLMIKMQREARGSQSEAPSADQSLGETSVFDHDDDDDDVYRGDGPHRGLNLRLEDSGFATGIRDDDEYTESFATPNEDSRDYSAFDDEQDPGLKSAARALSLSRLTLGTPPSAIVNQMPPQAI